MTKIAIFSGNANTRLARDICAAMDVDGVDTTRSTFDRIEGRRVALGAAMFDSDVPGSFSDGETRVQIQNNVRGVDCYVVQPTSAPANEHLMELFIMVDALRRASAGSITAVIPYYGYARQERKSESRTPITAALVANLLTAAGVNRVVAMDLHAPAIQGFFDMPVDHLYALPAFAPILRDRYQNAVVISPDAGGAARARAYSKAVPGTTMAIIDKRRARANDSEVLHILGDVDGRDCLIVDDMIDTAGTLVKGADALLAAGAKSVAACATHGVFSGEAFDRIATSELVEVLVTDTISLRMRGPGPVIPDEALEKIRVVTVAPLIAEAIRRIHAGDSVSSLFNV